MDTLLKPHSKVIERRERDVFEYPSSSMHLWLVSILIGYVARAEGDAGYLCLRVVYLLKSFCLLL